MEARPFWRYGCGVKTKSEAIEIRRATIDDVPLLMRLIKELAEYEKLSHSLTGSEELLREHLFGPRPAAEALIGSIDGTPLGFALYFQNFSTFLCRPGIYLEDIYVQPEARGRGLGKVLLGAVARIAVDRKCGRLEWAALDWNAPAIGFYRKLGAVPMSDWTTFRVTGETLEKLAAG
jgi:GNAT superfamily N-acetyltransferase